MLTLQFFFVGIFVAGIACLFDKYLYCQFLLFYLRVCHSTLFGEHAFPFLLQTRFLCPSV